MNGSGKSTILEAIKFALPPNPSLPDSSHSYSVTLNFLIDGSSSASFKRTSSNEFFVNSEVVSFEDYSSHLKSINIFTALSDLFLIKQEFVTPFLESNLLEIFERISFSSSLKGEIEALKKDLSSNEEIYSREFQKRKGAMKKKERTKEEQKELGYFIELEKKYLELEEKIKDSREKHSRNILFSSSKKLLEIEKSFVSNKAEKELNKIQDKYKEKLSSFEEIKKERLKKLSEIESLEDEHKKKSLEKMNLFSLIMKSDSNSFQFSDSSKDLVRLRNNSDLLKKSLNSLKKYSKKEKEELLKEISSYYSSKDSMVEVPLLDSSISMAEKEVEKLSKRNFVIETSKASSKENLSRLEKELSSITKKMDAFNSSKESLISLDEELRTLNSSLIEKKKKIYKLDSYLKECSFSKVKDNLVSELSSVFGSNKILGRVRDCLSSISPKFSPIVQTVFKNDLDTMLVDSAATSLSVFDYLRSKRLFVVKCLPVDSVEPKNTDTINNHDVKRVGDVVNVTGKYAEKLKVRFSSKLSTMIVSNIRAGMALAKEGKGSITEDCTTISPNGIVKVYPKKPTLNTVMIEEINENLEVLKREKDVIKNKIDKCDSEIEKNREIIEGFNPNSFSNLQNEINSIHSEMKDFEKEKKINLEKISIKKEKLEKLLKDKEKNISLMQKKSKHKEILNALDSLEEEKEIGMFIQDEKALQDLLSSEIEKNDNKVEKLEENNRELRSRVEAHKENLKIKEEKLSGLESQLKKEKKALETLTTKVKASNESLSNVEKKKRELEGDFKLEVIKQTNNQTAINNLSSEISKQLENLKNVRFSSIDTQNIEIEDLQLILNYFEEAEEEMIPDFDVEISNKEIQEMEENLVEVEDNMNSINPNFKSGDELAEIEESTLVLQKNFVNLRKKLFGLKKEIAEKEEKINEKFKETSGFIFQKTKEIYNQLCGGICHFYAQKNRIEFRAMPKGRKGIMAGDLSGGEKSVAAFSLICAINLFLGNKLLILDEIDSALDPEAVNGFVEMVRRLNGKEMGIQVVMISHNNQIYSKADSLIGVYNRKGERGILTLDLTKYDN